MNKACNFLVVISYVYHNTRFKNPENQLYSFFYLRARRWWVVKAAPQLLYSR